MRKALIAAVAALALCALVPGGRAQTPIIIKFSHVVAPDTPKGRAAEKFKELAEQYTNGRVRVEVYPNSQLYKDKEELEALQLGAVQMLAPSLAKFGPLGAREFEVYDLPFLVPNAKVEHAIFDGPIGQRMLASLESKGIVGLAYWDAGFRIFSANRPLRAPADFRGVKVRIQGSKVLEAQIKLLGALPQIMAFSEVYQALQTGVVDGAEGDRTNAFTQHIDEVQKYITLSDHGLLAYAVITNKAWWDGLPPDIREAITKAMTDATTYERSIAHQLDEDAEKGLAASGRTTLIHLTAEERENLVKALLPLYDQVSSRVGKGLIEEVRAAVKAAEANN